jgi:arginase family enzyme
MEGPLTTRTRTQPGLVALRCRTSERDARLAGGVDALAEALGERLGVAPRLIGAPQAPVTQRYEDDLVDSRGCLLEAGGQVEDALGGGLLPVLVAGDCAIALTTVPTIARLRPDAKLLWFDAHGDFNTPQTTPSGFLSGMCLAGACGCWSTGFEMDVFVPERVVLCGVRELDDGERDELRASGATVIGTELETLVYLQNALDGAPVYVHVDVDVLDPELIATPYPSPGGLPAEKLYDLLDAVADSCEVIGLEVTGLAAGADPQATAAAAALVAGALSPLFPDGRADGD